MTTEMQRIRRIRRKEQRQKRIEELKNDITNNKGALVHDTFKTFSQMTPFAGDYLGGLYGDYKTDTFENTVSPTMDPLMKINSTIGEVGLGIATGGTVNGDMFSGLTKPGDIEESTDMMNAVQMRKGGKIPPNKTYPPIKTTNPNDPRLKAYNDSLDLYNKYENDIKNQLKGVTQTLNPGDYWYDYYVKPSQKGKPITMTTGSYPFTGKIGQLTKEQQLGIDYPKGNIGFYLDNRSDVPIPAYKKPEQPYELSKEIQKSQVNPIDLNLNREFHTPKTVKTNPTKFTNNSATLNIHGKNVTYPDLDTLMEAKARLEEMGFIISGKDNNYAASRHKEPSKGWMDGKLLDKKGQEIELYPNGGLVDGNPNAEIEKKEVTRGPDGSLEQFNLPAHENATRANQVSLEKGTEIFSDTLKTIDGKTFAKEAGSLKRKRDKFEKNLEGNPTVISRKTNEFMMASIDAKADELFEEQEMQKITNNNKSNDMRNFRTGGISGVPDGVPENPYSAYGSDWRHKAADGRSYKWDYSKKHKNWTLINEKSGFEVNPSEWNKYGFSPSATSDQVIPVTNKPMGVTPPSYYTDSSGKRTPVQLNSETGEFGKIENEVFVPLNPADAKKVKVDHNKNAVPIDLGDNNPLIWGEKFGNSNSNAIIDPSKGLVGSESVTKNPPPPMSDIERARYIENLKNGSIGMTGIPYEIKAGANNPTGFEHAGSEVVGPSTKNKFGEAANRTKAYLGENGKDLLPYAQFIPRAIHAFSKVDNPELQKMSKIKYDPLSNRDEIAEIDRVGTTTRDAIAKGSNYAPVSRAAQLGVVGQQFDAVNKSYSNLNRLNQTGEQRVTLANSSIDQANTTIENTERINQAKAESIRDASIDQLFSDVGDTVMRQNYEKALMEKDQATLELIIPSLIKNGAVWDDIKKSMIPYMTPEAIKKWDDHYGSLPKKGGTTIVSNKPQSPESTELLQQKNI